MAASNSPRARSSPSSSPAPALLELVVVELLEVGGAHARFLAGEAREAPVCLTF